MILKPLHQRAYLITKPEHIFYLTKFSGEGFVIVLKKTFILATDQRYWLLAKSLQTPHLHLLDLKRNWEKKLQQLLMDIKIIYYEESHMTIKNLENWKKNLPHIKWRKSLEILEQCRMIKKSNELRKLKKAAALGDQILQSVIPLLQPGVTEKSIALALRHKADQIADGVSFDPIVAFGDHGAIPHHHNTHRRLKKNDAILIDQGVQYQGYMSDMTRCFFIGKGITEVKKMYAPLLTAQNIGISMVKEGIKIADIDKKVRKLLGKYEKYFTHSLGHGVGLEIHEAPTISRKNQEKLKIGMVITIEPGIYIPHIGGVRIEDTVIVLKNGCEVITKSTKKTILP